LVRTWIIELGAKHRLAGADMVVLLIASSFPWHDFAPCDARVAFSTAASIRPLTAS